MRGTDPHDPSSRLKGGEGIPPLPAELMEDVPPSPGSSNLNGIFEPGESIVVEPAWIQLFGLPWNFTSSASQFSGPPGATYTIVDGASTYQLPQNGGFCLDCFVMSLDDPVVRPAEHWDATFVESTSFGEAHVWTLHVGKSFGDVPVEHPFYVRVETLFHSGVTAGCGGNHYCPDAPVSRAQMSVFLLKGKNGAGYVPPPATGTVFVDVPVDSFAADWIEDAYSQGVTDACQAAPPTFCPTDPVSRSAMAVFLLKMRNGSDFVPPACTGLFEDVPCGPSPAYPVDWIEELANEGITAGCGGGNYCPDALNARGQMAVFITKAFYIFLAGS